MTDDAARRRYRIKYRTVEALKKRTKAKAEKFASFVFPVIRNLAEHDLIDQLVDVQPMPAPPAGAFYMDIAHGADRTVVQPFYNPGGMDDGLVRNGEELLRRRAEMLADARIEENRVANDMVRGIDANIVDRIVNVLEHPAANATQEEAIRRLTFKTLFAAIVKAPRPAPKLAPG